MHVLPYFRALTLYLNFIILPGTSYFDCILAVNMPYSLRLALLLIFIQTMFVKCSLNFTNALIIVNGQ